MIGELFGKEEKEDTNLVFIRIVRVMWKRRKSWVFQGEPGISLEQETKEENKERVKQEGDCTHDYKLWWAQWKTFRIWGMLDWVREEYIKALMRWQSEKELIENPGLFRVENYVNPNSL